MTDEKKTTEEKEIKAEVTKEPKKTNKTAPNADLFAVIKAGGKQYLVKEGDTLKIEKLEIEEGKKITFDEVLLVSDKGTAKIGTPLVEGAKVEAQVNANLRDRKITIIRYKPKTRYTIKKGHRQPHTQITIQKITA